MTIYRTAAASVPGDLVAGAIVMRAEPIRRRECQVNRTRAALLIPYSVETAPLRTCARRSDTQHCLELMNSAEKTL